MGWDGARGRFWTWAGGYGPRRGQWAKVGPTGQGRASGPQAEPLAQEGAVLTGGHCASLSDATICTLRCFAWDLPRDFTSRCSTWGRRGQPGVAAGTPARTAQPPPQHGREALGLPPTLPRACTHLGGGDFDVDDDGGQGRLGQLGRVVDGVGIQGHQLQGPGQLEDALGLALDLGCQVGGHSEGQGGCTGGRAGTWGLLGDVMGPGKSLAPGLGHSSVTTAPGTGRGVTVGGRWQWAPSAGTGG